MEIPGNNLSTRYQVLARKYLNEEVQYAQWYDEHQEVPGTVGDDEHRTQHGEQRAQVRAERLRQQRVYRLDVAREAVDDAADRGRVVEGHGRAQYVGQHGQVQAARGENRTDGQAQRVEEDE